MKEKLQEGIIVKTKTGDFRVLKNGQLEEEPTTEIIVPEDDLMVVDEVKQQTLKQEEKNKNISIDLNKSSTTFTSKKVVLDKKPTANFYMDVSDEREVSQFKEKASEEKNRAIKDFIEAKAIEVINQAGLGEAAMKNQQLKNIVISRIRNVRSLAETKEALGKLVITDNNWPDDWIGTLIALIEKDRDRVAEMIHTGDIPKIKIEARDIESKIKKIERKPIDKMMDVQYKKDPEVIDGSGLAKNIVMGPVDEIRSINLADFRKLAENPAEAADKILQKISLLEDESLLKKAQGVTAWHDSEIYKVYLQIGAASMSEKKPIEQVIRELREKGKLYLAPEEFNVVADLNRKLSY